jgi:hypothetical protein
VTQTGDTGSDSPVETRGERRETASRSCAISAKTKDGLQRHREAQAPLAVAALMVLPVILFARHLTDGLLSDDFLYARWANESFSTLILRLTVDSYPKVLRPVLAPLWLLSGSAPGVVAMHLLSLLLHGAIAALLFQMARRFGSPFSLALLLALLFLMFPLSGEATLWLSGGFDLWSSAFVLLALAVLEVSSGEFALGGSVLFFILALLSKESVFCVPLAFLLIPHVRLRRALPLMASALVYLAVRITLFRGVGGYTSDVPDLFSWSRITGFVRVLLLQMPARILVPTVSNDSLFRGAVLGFSVLLLGAFLLLSFRALGIAAALAAFILGALPAASIIRVEWDLQGGRLVYLPMILSLLTLSAFPRSGKNRLGLLAGAGMVLLWTVLSIHNAGRWTEAQRHVKQTMAAMSRTQKTFPPGATVLVDTLDTFEGAYVFRNGLPEAAMREGLRSDLHWQRGTPAGVRPSARERLGTSLFALAPTDSGESTDLTQCFALLSRANSPMESRPAMPVAAPMAEKGGAIFGPFTADGRHCMVATIANKCPLEGETRKLFWKDDGEREFETMRSVEVRIEGNSAMRVLLKPNSAVQGNLWLRIDSTRPEDHSCYFPVLVGDCPVACR